MKLNTILTLFFAMAILFASTNDGPVTVVSTGTVPFVVSFNTADGAGEDGVNDLNEASGNFADVEDDDYDRPTDDTTTNYFIMDNILQCIDFDANHAVVVSLTKSSWVLPGTYNTSLPVDATLRKNTGGTDVNQFFVKVNVTDSGYSSVDDNEGLVAQSSFGTNYTGLSEAQTTILLGGSSSHGVEDGQFDVDARVIFDWLLDIPGDYTVNLTLTVVEG